jgi:Fic family protein
MKTLQFLANAPATLPTVTAMYLSELGEARGRQELFTRQSPQKLKVLREHALIESAVSSNRIEGVTIDRARAATVVLGKAALRDRNEEEVRGYRDALKLIHEGGPDLPVSEKTIRRLHRITRGEIWDAGKYKVKDGDIIERYPDGAQRVRFRTVPAAQTPQYMSDLVSLWRESLRERSVPSPVALAAFNLDFLCIHPFRDGNGRVSRLLLLLQCYRLGMEVGRYISMERLIEENKERYYETLEESSHRWHDGKHDPWPYVNFVLYTLKTAYREFESRLGQVKSPRGSKTELVIAAIAHAGKSFRVSDLLQACPGVSIDLIRRVLKGLSGEGKVACLGRGQNAEWKRTGKWQLGSTH